MLYIIGSLNNPRVVEVTKTLHRAGVKAFSQWMAAGPDADQHWKNYGAALGWSYREMLRSEFVQTAFQFDYRHMDAADGCVLVMPAGKSAHCEFGWFVGRGKRAYLLFDGEPERPDLMPPNLATAICFSLEELLAAIKPSPAPSVRHPGVVDCGAPQCLLCNQWSRTRVQSSTPELPQKRDSDSGVPAPAPEPALRISGLGHLGDRRYR
jgi:hypothetical protein